MSFPALATKIMFSQAATPAGSSSFSAIVIASLPSFSTSTFPPLITAREPSVSTASRSGAGTSQVPITAPVLASNRPIRLRAL